jgi:aromatic-L-amino-acid decarboxylase
LRNKYSDAGTVVDYRNWQIPLGRRFRSLKVWFVMRSYGLNGMKSHIRKGIRVGSAFADMLRSRSDLFKIITTPSFGLVVFRILHPNPSDMMDSNSLTEKVYTMINSEKEFFLSSTAVGGLYAIRVVSANQAAEETYVRRVFELITSLAEKYIASETAIL